MTKIKAILIDSKKKEIKRVEVENSFTGKGGMYEVLGFDMIEHGKYMDNGDILLVDEEGNLRRPMGLVWYMMGNFIGNGLVVGQKGMDYTDCKSTVEDIQRLVNWK